MSAILFVNGDARQIEQARESFAANYPDIDFLLSPADGDCSEVATAVAAKGYSVIMARGSRIAGIRDLNLPVTVVEVSVTALDTLRALKQAPKRGGRIGVVGSPSSMTGVEELAELLHLDVRVYRIAGNHMAWACVEEAIGAGAEVIMGGALTTGIAAEMGYPTVLIISRDGLLQAAREATEIVNAIRQEQRRSGLFGTLLGHINEGIIAVDNQGSVIVCNPAAERITGVTEAIGSPADRHFTQFGLGEILHTGEGTTGSILRCNDTDIVCNKVPVFVDGIVVAAIAAFQEVGRLQNMEANIRQHIYDLGHAATATFETMQVGSDKLRLAVSKAKEFARTDSSILLLGETGTGKELFAQSIHNYSARKRGPFVAINCAALPGQLLESELFGYVGGAFTGANPKGKPGMFELAHGGTLLLDEIGEMDIQVQGKLLRVLEERKIMRLGSDRVLPVDVRLITATNRNLRELIRKNAFRPDLYYRLNVLRLRIPPLRDRIQDIPMLAAYFLRVANKTGRTPALTKGAEKALQSHKWPGNIRELRNIIERLAVEQHESIDEAVVVAHLAEEMADLSPVCEDPDLSAIYDALAECGGNYTRAAKMLGLNRVTLWRKLRR